MKNILTLFLFVVPYILDSQSMDGYGQRSAPPPFTVDLLGDNFDDSASVPPNLTVETVDLLGGALVPATNPNAAYPQAPPPPAAAATTYPQQYPVGYPPAPPQQSYTMSPQQQNYQYPIASPPSQSYPQPMPHQPTVAPPPPTQQPLQASGAFEYGGYQQQPSHLSQQPGTYPMTSYPQFTQF
jgi:hypothetical protein